jgi:hypothetical protein
MDWKSTFVRATLDLLAIVCALLFVIPLGLLLCGTYTAGCWIAERVKCTHASDATHASIQLSQPEQHERVTHMPTMAPHETTAGTPLPTSPQPVHQHSKEPAEDLTQWTRDLNAYGSLYGVHFTQDQAARLFLYERGLKLALALAPTESEAER